jgi:hypothetical protein
MVREMRYSSRIYLFPRPRPTMHPTAPYIWGYISVQGLGISIIEYCSVAHNAP